MIGPNDSGKSTILRALRTVGQLVRSSFERRDETWIPFDPGLDESGGITKSLTLSATTPFGTYTFEKGTETRMGGHGGVIPTVEHYEADGGATDRRSRNPEEPSELLHGLPSPHPAFGLAMSLSAVHYFAFSEDGLRRPSGFMPKDRVFLSPRGEGLPGLYFALRNDREEAFERILEDVRTLFPTVKTVRTQPRSTTELEIEVELRDGTRVRAAHVSTGLLYYLAFAALPEFFGHIATILLEEPENGLQ